MVQGQCECGAVAFEVEAVKEAVTVCHCSQCRRLSGHLWAAAHTQFDQVRFLKEEGLRWYTSSDWAKRGFCGECGSSLFYRMNDSDRVGIAVGSLNDTEALHIGRHIFVKDKGDYYPVPDDAPVFDKI